MNNNTMGGSKFGLSANQALSMARVLVQALAVVVFLASLGATAAGVLSPQIRALIDWLLMTCRDENLPKVMDIVRENSQYKSLLHDVPFRIVFKDQYGLVARLLEAITGKKNITIERLYMQLNFQLKDGARGYILDCLAIDTNGVRYNMEPQIDSSEANDGRALGHLGRVILDAQAEGLDSSKTPEVWIIFLTKATHMNTGKVLYEQTVGQLRNSPLAHIVYYSCGLASKHAKNADDWNTPDEGIDLERWHDLLRWGSDIVTENNDEIYDDELRNRKKFMMDREGEWSNMEVVLASWLQQQIEEKMAANNAVVEKAKAEAKNAKKAQAEEIAKTMIINGATRPYVIKMTGLDSVIVNQVWDSVKAERKAARAASKKSA